MYKLSTFLAESDSGYAAVPLFGPADSAFEKTAAGTLLPEVLTYISNLKPRPGSQYVLVNAMGAGEYYGSNINGDYFEESGLIHTPPQWSGDPLLDRAVGKGWTYGYPTFYNAYPYAHHRNKDPSRAYGEVELAVWHEGMKRVELICRVDYDKCQQFGGSAVWDKLKLGQFPDVSMGCLPAGSLITMVDGTQKPIELVRETEWVLTHTGAHRRVTDTMRRPHPGSVFRFNVYGFRRELVVTGNHPLWLVDGEQLACAPKPRTVNNGRKQRHCTPFVKASSKGCVGCSVEPTYTFEWRRADEAQVGDYLAFPIPTLRTNGVLSGNRSLARLLGYYLAEGHVSNYNDRSREQVNFSLNYEERELAEEIEQLARSLGVEVLWHHENPAAGARTVSIVSKQLAELCSLHCGDGAKTKILSKDVLHEDPEVLLELLGAYLNGDGGTYGGSAYFSTSSVQLAHQLFVALARCGLIASINKNEHKPSEKSVVKKETTEYQVWVGPDFSWKLEPYISKPVRKSLKVRGQRFFYEKDGVTYLMAPILEIDEAPHDADVFNFSVEGDESYVAEGLAVHNSKVCYDLSSITTDWENYHRALASFDPKKFAYPGLAVVEFHKKLKAKNGVGIRGLSITRNDYDEWTKNHMNIILPDGRKVFVYNPYPRFFDISFVFIGADRTAKTMVFIVRCGDTRYVSGAEAGEKIASVEPSILDHTGAPMQKTAGISDALLKNAFRFKGAEDKQSEIKKEVPADKAVPLLSQNDKDLPEWAIRALSSVPEGKALGTTASMGIVLKPKEFQRITLIRLGKKDYADQLAAANKVFPQVEEVEEKMLSPMDFLPALARKLLSLLDDRSALGPYVEKRVIIQSKNEDEPPTSHKSEDLRKIGAAYNGYRQALMEMVATAQDFLPKAAPVNEELAKLAGAPVESIFTPLTFNYLQNAFPAPVAVSREGVVQPMNTSVASVQRGFPSRNTWM